MPLETASYPTDLVSSNPVPTDPTNQGDDHIRLMKSVVKNALPGVNSPFTRTIGSSFGSLHGDGTSLSPGIAFTLEPSLGFYRNTAGSVTFNGIFAASGGFFTGGTGVNTNIVVASGAGAFGGAVTAASFATAGTGSFGPVSGTTGTFSGVVSAPSFVGALAAGFVMDFAGTAPPTGWAACDGQALSRTTYAQLFSNIGTTWGAGDGSTTFNVPNLISRFRRHRDNSTLASVVGTLQSPVNLSHAHTYSGNTGIESVGHTHTYSGATGSEGVQHTHTFSGTSAGFSSDHTHSISLTSGAMSANASHSHALGGPQSAFIVSINNGTGASQGNLVCTSASVSAGLTTSSTNTDHTHAVTGNTGGSSTDHTHAYSGTTSTESALHAHAYSGTTSGISADHTHAYSGTTSASGDGNEARPYSATMLTCIKLFN